MLHQPRKKPKTSDSKSNSMASPPAPPTPEEKLLCTPEEALRIFSEMREYIKKDFEAAISKEAYPRKINLARWKNTVRTDEKKISEYLDKLACQLSLATEILNQSDPITSKQAVKIVTLWKCLNRLGIIAFFKKRIAQHRTAHIRMAQGKIQGFQEQPCQVVEAFWNLPLQAFFEESKTTQSRIGISKEGSTAAFCLKLLSSTTKADLENICTPTEITPEQITKADGLLTEIAAKGGVSYFCKNSTGQWDFSPQTQSYAAAKVTIVREGKRLVDTAKIPTPISKLIEVGEVWQAQWAFQNERLDQLISLASVPGYTAQCIIGYLAVTQGENKPGELMNAGYKRDYYRDKEWASSETYLSGGVFYLTPEAALANVETYPKFLLSALLLDPQFVYSFYTMLSVQSSEAALIKEAGEALIEEPEAPIPIVIQSIDSEIEGGYRYWMYGIKNNQGEWGLTALPDTYQISTLDELVRFPEDENEIIKHLPETTSLAFYELVASQKAHNHEAKLMGKEEKYQAVLGEVPSVQENKHQMRGKARMVTVLNGDEKKQSIVRTFNDAGVVLFFQAQYNRPITADLELPPPPLRRSEF